MVKSLLLWRLRLQYWGVLLKEQANLKVNLVIGFIEDQVHTNQFFNVSKSLHHIRIKNVNTEV